MFFTEILVIHGQLFPRELLVEVSESRITELSIFFVCRRQCSYIFWQGIVLPGLFSSEIVSFRENLLKTLSPLFSSNFYFFHQMRALQKLWKMLFISSKMFFSFSRCSIFCISVLPSFSTCRPLIWRMIEILKFMSSVV